jgi:FO synthase
LRNHDRIADILDKASSGAGLTYDEGVALYRAQGDAWPDVFAAADALKRRLHGDRVSYIVNRNVNFTNVCIICCKFCGFWRSKRDDDAYTLDLAGFAEKMAETPNVSELCVQGGINPDIPFDYYLELLRWMKRKYPTVHLHAYSPQEIHQMSKIGGMSYRDVLATLRDNGLDSLIGTAAEIFDDDVRKRIAPRKITSDEWEEIVTTAHSLGIRSTATIMFGHVEPIEARVAHLDRLRRIHRKHRGFTELVPLPFIPYATMLGKSAVKEQLALDDCKRFYAVARLFLGDEMPNLQTSWVKLGVEGAKETLSVGVNDFGGTLYEENITKCARGGACGNPGDGECLTEEQIVEAISSAGKTPVRRTTLYKYLTPKPA